MTESQTTLARRKKGMLVARLAIDSENLRAHLPIEVRDSDLGLVRTVTTGESVELDPGLYEVSAVLDDGRKHRKVVQVEEGKQRRVGLRVDPQAWRAPVSLGSGDDKPELLDLVGARRVAASDTRWEFCPKGPIGRVPYADLKLGRQTIRVSLPINPEGYDREASSCSIRFERSEVGLRAQVDISAGRKVSSTIQHMMSQGEVFAAHFVSRLVADDLLREKYNDPVGAALGAQLLFQAGTLEKREEWLKNLAKSFPWLPDGSILLGALEVGMPAQRDQGISRLVRASRSRPMFTFAFSVLLDTLRRVSRDPEFSFLNSVVKGLAERAGQLDWSALVVTERLDLHATHDASRRRG